MGDWEYIDDIKSLEGVNTLHCDTRDFHCMTRDENLDMRDGRNKEIKCKLHNADYIIPENELLSFIKRLETMSGGKGEWRCLNFEGVNCGGWLKYVRCYRTKKGDFIVCNRDNEPIEWRKCTEEALNKEHLGFSED